MKLATIFLAVGLSLAAPLLNAAPSGPQVQWLNAAADADIEQAFAQGRTENKPVLLYWGAAWCPPCNQLKATLFNRQDFIARSQSFVAVNIDGDLPGAQKLGARFKVRGYPTMILATPDGTELTRLPGEVDAAQVMQVLQIGLARGRPVAAVLADARAGKPLKPDEWKLLAFYSWDTDEAQLVSEVERPGLLAQLAAACPKSQPDVADRMLLKALAGSDDGKGIKADAATLARVRKLLANPAEARMHMDVVTNYASEITKAMANDPGKPRTELVAAFDAALRKLQADATLSRADRFTALMARVDLARLSGPKAERHPKLPAALVAEVREHSARADREITDGYERQAVITAAAHTLGLAGLWSESDALLQANLPKSHSPYYLMSQLGGNARKLGRNDDALRWHEQAFNTSVGPATRLEWGARYISTLVELSPQDAPRIERAAAALFTEAAAQPNVFYERSARSLKRVGTQLKGWNKGPEQAAVVKRLQAQMDGVCTKLDAKDPQRAACEAVLKGSAGAPT